jgi:hypothetical protein
VCMIGHQRPGIHGSFRSGSQLSQTLHKIFAVGNIVDNPAFFDSSHNYMIQGPRRAWVTPLLFCSVLDFQSSICFLTDLMKRPNALSFFRLSRYDISWYSDSFLSFM